MLNTLRARIVLTLIPMFLLLALVGGAGIVLLKRLGQDIDAILRENYRSVNYMERLNESLERIDSSFNFALAGREDQARKQYEANWWVYRENLALEQANITLQGERELVERLTDLTTRYHRQGDAFYGEPANNAQRVTSYHDPHGLLDLFKEIKIVSGEIRRINQENMEQAGAEARKSAGYSTTLLGAGLVVAAVLAGLLGWNMTRSILQPIRAVTESAREISAGNLDQVMPVVSADELGELSQTFNVMTRHLREYRQSQLDQLLRAQQTSQATIDSFPDAVLVIDGDSRVEMANPAARRLLGVVPAIKGQAASPWQAPAPLRQPLTEALQGQRDYLPESFDRSIVIGSDGQECTVLPRILTIRDPHGHTLGAAVVLQDVTRFRLLDQVKSNLVATASHELKTPLTGIRLAIHLLLEESVGPVTSKQLELLLDARENSERLLAVVNNLLDLARLEQGSRQLNIWPEAPRTLLQSAADTIGARAHDKSIELNLEVPDGLPAIAVDVERMAHALGNLLDNALTYTERGGRITLSAAADVDSVVVSVADTGAGIPAEHLPHIFEKFFRVPGRSRGAGTGLGLAIVHEIVLAHGGTVTCESSVGVGTTFCIRLPIATGESSPGYVFGHVGGNTARSN
jgi:NtrC-family two-component system sensor histidine kinase KinB